MTPHELWFHFFNAPGSNHGSLIGIASYKAVHGMTRLIHSRRPMRILEIGSGIGTLTATILYAARSSTLCDHPEFVFATLENHPFCLQQLSKNLHEFTGSYTLIHSVDALSHMPVRQFDLIVVDGGGGKDNDDAGHQNISGLLAPKGMIFIEGDRSRQRSEILDTWYTDRDHVETVYRSPMAGFTAHHPELGDIHVSNKSYRIVYFEPSIVRRILSRIVNLWGNYPILYLRKLTHFRTAHIAAAAR